LPLSDPQAASPSEAELGSLRDQQRAGDHALALAGARALLARFPQDRDSGLIEASALRHLNRIDEALAALDRLAARHPRFSLLHQERGLCHVVRRDAPAAIAAFELALQINAALPKSWQMLEGLQRLTGQSEAAAATAAQGAWLDDLPEEIVTGIALFSDGDLARAEPLIRQFLLTRGDHPEAMRLLARIGMAHEVYDDAEILLAGVVALMPEHRAAALEYAQTLAARHKYAEAEVALAPLMAEEPQNSVYRTLAATVAVGLGRQEEAIGLYRGMLAELPEEPLPGTDPAGLAVMRADLNLWSGHALKTLGDTAGAIAAYRAAIAVRPAFGDAWWSLANLKTYRFDESEIAAMQAAEAESITPQIDRVHLAFALGKALEDSGRPAEAWQHYATGNALQRAESRYRPDIFETNTAEQKRVCTPAFFAEREGWGDQTRAPIFVLGLPRSGSTLIEQILASHPAVEGTQELPDIQSIVLGLQGRDPDLDNPRYPAALLDLGADEVKALGARYLAGTLVHRILGRPLFIDKMPNNFRHVGLIKLILPNAVVIDARREPMACCFSNLKQLFAQGQEFTYSIPDIARYYATYLEVMRHWDAALPGFVLRVINEDVIEDLEGQVRRLLDHCGLPFDPACLAFHQTVRAVRTPSSEQVRRPINRNGLDQWRAFEPFLGELKTALGSALEDWRD
jgi:tetratricopeptide (TPR) repeat protein